MKEYTLTYNFMSKGLQNVQNIKQNFIYYYFDLWFNKVPFKR